VAQITVGKKSPVAHYLVTIGYPFMRMHKTDYSEVANVFLY